MRVSLRMKSLLVAMLVACCLMSAPARAQEVAAEPLDHWDGIELAEAVSQTTGIAISPLLGVGALGAWTYFQAPQAQREQLPWFAQMWFWLPALGLVALLVAKDPLLGLVPVVKKPLDALDVVEDKVSAVLASAVVVPMLIAVFSRSFAAGDVTAAASGPPFLLAAAFPAFLSGAAGKVVIALSVVGMMAAFFITWLAAHTINVLILLSPFGPLDTLLRAVKGLVLMALMIATLIAPVLGLLVSVLIIVVAWRVAGWSFRFTVFGSVVAWDILTFERRRVVPETEPMRAFSGPGLAGIAPRTYGELRRQGDGPPVFAYRPWLLLPERRIALPADGLAVGKGLFAPVMIGAAEGESESKHFVRFPPRFLGHEEALAERLGAERVRLLGVRRHLGGLVAWVRESFSGARERVASQLD